MKIPVFNPERLVRKENPLISSAIISEDLLYISGMGPLDINKMEVIRGTIEEETDLTLHHIDLLLKEAGCGRGDVLKCTCYLANLEDYDGLNRSWQKFFEGTIPPARTTVRADLLRGILVEIDAVARIPKGARKSEENV